MTGAFLSKISLKSWNGEPWRTDKKRGMSTKGTSERAQMRLDAGREKGRIVTAEREIGKEYLVRKSIRGNGRAA